MIEDQIFLDTPDGKKIFCAIDRAQEKRSSKAVVLAHGLTGHPLEYLHMMAKNYFVEKGYDVYRLAFYWFGPDTRKLDECTLKIHAQDLNQVIDMVKEEHEHVFCVGHSYGGMVQIISNPSVNALSFWDSSYIPGWEEGEYEILLGTNYRVLPWGSRHLIGMDMFQEAKDLTENKCKKLAEQITSPSLVINAEKTMETYPWQKELYTDLSTEKHYKEIKKADHDFVSGNTVFDLLDATHQWFERF